MFHRNVSAYYSRRLAAWEPEGRSRVLVLTHRIQVNRAGLSINPVVRGVVILGEEKTTCQAVRRSMKGDSFHLLYSQATAPVTGVVIGFVNLESVLVACQDGKIDVPVRAERLCGSTGERRMQMMCFKGKFMAKGAAFVAVNPDVEISVKSSGVLDNRLSKTVVGLQLVIY